MPRISRRALAAIIVVSALMPGGAFAADALKEIRIDWATYNPVSMILKQKGLLEKEFAKDGISIVWVRPVPTSARVSQRRIDRFRFHGRLRGAGGQDQRQSDQVDLCVLAARMDRAGDDERFEDIKRRRPQG